MLELSLWPFCHPKSGFSGRQDGPAGMAIGRAGLLEGAVPAGSWSWLMWVPTEPEGNVCLGGNVCLTTWLITCWLQALWW